MRTIQQAGALIFLLAISGCKTIVDVPDGPADSGDPDPEDDGGVDFVVCGGKVCNHGQDPVCGDARTLLIWDGAPGSCNEGQCSYRMIQRPCAYRCVEGACVEEEETDSDSDESDSESETHLAGSDTGPEDAGDGGEMDAGGGPFR